MLRPGVGADHQQIHEIRKAGPMLVALARLDAPVDIEARPDIADDAADARPSARTSTRPARIGTNKNASDRKPDREHRAREEEIGHRARIVDAGLDQPAAQHLHVVAVAGRIMLGGVVDARAARPCRLECRSERVAAGPSLSPTSADAGGAALDRALHAHHRHDRERQRARRPGTPAPPPWWSCRRPSRVETSVDPWSDLEIDHAVHDEVADRPSSRRRTASAILVMSSCQTLA